MLGKVIYKITKNKILLIIILFAIVSRLIYLNELPPALNWDEVSHGYNAYSILKTGKDEWGKSFPVIFRAYGDYKLPVYIYTTALSIFVFGMNAFAVRLPSAMAGAGTVIFTYLLVIELFAGKRLMLNSLCLKKEKKRLIINHKLLAVVASLLVAIEPWSLFLSRGAFEANLALMLFVGGVYFLISGLKNPGYFCISSLLLGLSVWTYNSYRIFTPLMLAVFVVLYKMRFKIMWKKNKKILLNSVFILMIFLIPMFVQLLNEAGQARYAKVAIIDEGVVNRINEQRAATDYPPFIERMLYNKVLFFIRTFVSNWSAHYSPEFLFIQGGSQYQYSLWDHGLLYIVNLPFLLLGFILSVWGFLKKEKVSIILVAWIILAPIPASITRDSPHALRTITLLPVLMFLTSYGLVSIYNYLSTRLLHLKPYLVITYIVLLFVSLFAYWNKYSGSYTNHYSWSWQYGYKEAVEYIKGVYGNYEKIIISKKYGEPHEFVLFYWPWDPLSFQKDKNLVRFYQSGWYWVDRFDKFYFINDWDIPRESDENFSLESGGEFDCKTSRCLLITSPDNYHKDWRLLKTIYFLDGKRAFEILEK